MKYWDFGEYQEFAFIDTLLPNLYRRQVVFHSGICPITGFTITTTATRRRTWRQVIVSVGRGFGSLRAIPFFFFFMLCYSLCRVDPRLGFVTA